MKVCSACQTKMMKVISFEKGKGEKFYICPKCYGETKHVKVDKTDMDFREVLGIKCNKGCKKQ